jgi:hypothetical protein
VRDLLTVELLAVVHLAATAAMCGLIWFVQVVHYPLFAAVGADQFVRYEQQHRFRTGLVVGPLMAVETAGAALLAGIAVTGGAVAGGWAVCGLVLVLAVHLSTIAVQVPLHGTLGEGFDPVIQRRLVRSNWVRTVLWTARLVPAAALVAV